MNTPFRRDRHEAGPLLSYALRWRVGGVTPGAHTGSTGGLGGRLRQVVPFERSPDPRRLDLRTTARDPFGRLHVREFEQRSAATVEVLVDTSASMAFGGDASRLRRAAVLVDALAEAVRSLHDRFGLNAGAERIEIARTARRGDATSTTERLAALAPHGRSVEALRAAAERLVGRRRLVVLVSDFAFPIDATRTLLAVLAAHDVVPVLVGEHVERLLPRWGLADLSDLESGRRRLVVLRPSLRARWQAQIEARRRAVAGVCAASGRRPFVLAGEFDAEAFSDHLLEG